MKNTVKILVLIVTLMFCCLSFCSCGLKDALTSTDIVVKLNTEGEQLTTDMSESDLRDYLVVSRRLGIFPIGYFYKDISDYEIVCDYSEGYTEVKVIYEGMSSKITALFVQRDKLSLEGDFLFCEIKGENYLLKYNGCDKDIILPERDSYIIYDKVFYGNDTIESVTLGNSVTQIGESAFAYSSIKHIDFGEGLISIGERAFDACTQLEYVNVPSVEQWCLMIFGSTIPLKEVDSEITIQDQEYINIEAYLGMMTSMDYYHHTYGAKSITTDKAFIYFWNSNGKLVHQDPVPVSSPVYYANSIHIGGEKLKDLVIPENVNEISIGFAGADIESINIHKNVTGMGIGAFKDCENLNKIFIEDVNDGLLDRYAYAFDDDCAAFTKQNDLCFIGNEENPYLILVGLSDAEKTEIFVPDSTVAVASYALRRNGRNITKIVLSDSVEYVGRMIVSTRENSFTFIGGKGLRFIDCQEWFMSLSNNKNAEINIGDIDKWFYSDNGGDWVPVTKIGWFGILQPIYRIDSPTDTE